MNNQDPEFYALPIEGSDHYYFVAATSHQEAAHMLADDMEIMALDDEFVLLTDEALSRVRMHTLVKDRELTREQFLAICGYESGYVDTVTIVR